MSRTECELFGASAQKFEQKEAAGRKISPRRFAVRFNFVRLSKKRYQNIPFNAAAAPTNTKEEGAPVSGFFSSFLSPLISIVTVSL